MPPSCRCRRRIHHDRDAAQPAFPSALFGPLHAPRAPVLPLSCRCADPGRCRRPAMARHSSSARHLGSPLLALANPAASGRASRPHPRPSFPIGLAAASFNTPFARAHDTPGPTAADSRARKRLLVIAPRAVTLPLTVAWSSTLNQAASRRGVGREAAARTGRPLRSSGPLLRA
jgi:hypothetical protein